MRNRLMAMGSVLSLAALVPTAVAASTSTPPRRGYQFAHGAVTHYRQWSLAMDITTEDSSNPAENGSFKVGFQARMGQFVVEPFPDGSGILNTVFDTVTTRVNGNTVTHAIPDTYDNSTGQFHRYNLLVHPDGTCNCSQLPALIYDVSGGYPHAVPLGDLLQYLHPGLPPAKMRLGTTWTTALPLSFSATHPGTVPLQSHLDNAKGAWSVVSRLDQKVSATITAQDYQASHPHDTLSSNAPVTVTGYIKVSSTLGLPATDGVNVVPMGAKSGTRGKFCGACTGYPFALEGEEHLHLLYRQSGAELALTDVDARLTVK